MLDFFKNLWGGKDGDGGIGGLLSSLFDGTSSDGMNAGISALFGLGNATGLFPGAKTPPTGYQGGIPKRVAVQEMVPNTYDPNRVPGSSGQQYRSQMQYVPQGKVPQARQTAITQAQQYAQQNANNPAMQRRPMPMPNAARGGIVSMANGRFLNGTTDGMTDQVAAQIGNDQPAALSDGEFIVPADVVSHLGNGSSNAGAEQLFNMMEGIRKARTGKSQQAPQINPKQYM
jgi:hypothetical protein